MCVRRGGGRCSVCNNNNVYVCVCVGVCVCMCVRVVVGIDELRSVCLHERVSEQMCECIYFA